jgi:leader peptidase (prepilin peptidase)/N-methyltransferase
VTRGEADAMTPSSFANLPAAHILALILVGGLAGAASLTLVPAPAGVFGLGLALLMLLIAAIDGQRFVIPDELSAGSFLLALAYGFVRGLANDAPWEGIVMAAVRGAALALVFLALREAYRRLRGREGLGLGDVKLAGVAGAWLDWTMIPVAIEIAALAALAAYFLRSRGRQRPLRIAARLPFGLFLAPAIWLCWMLEAALLKAA